MRSDVAADARWRRHALALVSAAMAHEGYHEPYEQLTEETRDMHRAIISLMEELEAIDWYQQRVDVTPDETLKAVLAHNRDEEIEHAMMTLEWLRRRNAVIDENARTYLFTEGPITEVEEAATEGGSGNGESEENGADAKAPAAKKAAARKPAARANDGSLGIGSLNPSSGA